MVRRLGFLVVLLSTTVAFAKIGPRDRGGYVGMDSIATPGPALPASFLVPSPSPAAFTAVTGGTLQDDQSYEIGGFTGLVYGSTINDCFVHTNGVITCQSQPAAFFDNRQLPDPRWSGAVVIAPFWDDLAVVPGVSQLTYGISLDGNSLVVQWTDFALYNNPSARLTFRAEIQLNTGGPNGYVLFQYLKMQGTGADGSSATIGLQATDAITFNQYSFNMAGAVKTGDGAGSALQAILFDYDADGDRLPARLESVLTTSDNNRDSDGGGRDDGAEFAAGLNPKDSGDDGTCTQTPDNDTICAEDEPFYGTNPNSADSDGDGINDDQELFFNNGAGDRTFPDKADSDGDGANDKAELDNGTDPRNPADVPTSAFSLDSSEHRPQAVVDSDGNVHVVADNAGTGVNYWMLDSTGKVIIPQTFIKAPFLTSSDWVTRPVVKLFGGKIYIVYEFRHSSPFSCDIGFIRLNPAAVSGMVPDGGIAPSQIVEVTKAITVPGVPGFHHQNIAVGSNGVHVTYTVITNSNGFAQEGTDNTYRQGFGYAHLDLDGNLLGSQDLMDFNMSNAGNYGSDPGGVDRRAEARIVLDDQGVAHVVAHVFMHPRNDGGCSGCDRDKSGLYYMAVSGPTELGPFYLASGVLEYHDIAYKEGLVFVSAGGGSHFGQDLRLGAFDPYQITAMPRDNDYHGVGAAIDPTSMRLPMTSLFVDDNGVHGSSVTVTDSGVVLLGYGNSDGDSYCIAAASSTGTLLATPRCMLNNVDYRTNVSARLLPLPSQFVGLAYDDSYPTGTLYFARFPMSLIADVSGVTPINHQPHITSTAPNASAFAGGSFSYAAVATDPDSGQTLTWSLSNAPAGMTVDPATGNVTWSPTANDVGGYDPVIQVCDNGQPSACDSQSFHVDVAGNTPPKITSIPAVTAQVGAPWQYQVVAVDQDGDAITYSLSLPSPAPGNLAMNATGLVTWTPTAADVGTLSIVVKATDSAGLSDSQAFNVGVGGVQASNAPEFVSIPATSALEGKTYNYQAVAVDADNSAAKFTYTLTSTASGNLALSTDGALTWKPTSKERGTVSITIQAKEDDGEIATQSFNVTVGPTPSSGSSGCGCHVGETEPAANGWMFGAVVMVGFLWQRRRSRQRQ